LKESYANRENPAWRLKWPVVTARRQKKREQVLWAGVSLSINAFLALLISKNFTLGDILGERMLQPILEDIYFVSK